MKTRWRHQALLWLKADLNYWAKQAESGTSDANARTKETLQHWTADRALHGIREEKELAQLPELEQNEWHAFWSEVAALFKKVGSS